MNANSPLCSSCSKGMVAREEEEEEEEGSSLCAGLPREGRQAAKEGECRASACNCANTNAAKANFTEFHSADFSLSQDSSA